MDEIRELVRIVSNSTKRTLPLLDIKAREGNANKELNLFLGIKNEVFTSDEEASRGIYGGDVVDYKFRMLKSRLSRKLLNHLFFMDFASNHFSKSARSIKEVQDYCHFSKMLLRAGETELGTKLLVKTIDLARECELTGVLSDSLRELRGIYAKTYRPRLFQNVRDQLQKNEELERLEEEADLIFQEDRLSINSSINNQKKDLESYLLAVSKLKTLWDETGSYNIYDHFFKLKIQYLQLIGDFDGVLQFIRDIEDDLAHGKVNHKRFDLLFVCKAKGNALIKNKKFDEGRVFLEKMLVELGHNTRGWCRFAEMLVLVNLHTQRHSDAIDIYLRVKKSPSFSLLEDKQVFRWSIIRAYLFHFTQNKRLLRKYDHQQFMQRAAVYTKEEAGCHLSMLILRVVGNIAGDKDLLSEYLSVIGEYVNKHLNNSFSKRTKSFCKLLHKAVACRNDPDTLMAKSRYLRQKLNYHEIAGDSYLDFEVIPYERMWANLLSTISNKVE
jgi:hypothetical protein